MHKIDRTSVTEPSCLSKYDQTQKWEHLRTDHKRKIGEVLAGMQQKRCAYCEGLYHSDGHIEHFRRRSTHPTLTFAWTNLFLSCEADGHHDHCGHYKDRGGSPYNLHDLIKPDGVVPNDFFYFHSSGEVRPRSGIDGRGNQRAKETIRVLNLCHPRLKVRRHKAVQSYLRTGILEELESLSPEDRQKYIEMEIEEQRNLPYWTTIRHFLEKMDP